MGKGSRLLLSLFWSLLLGGAVLAPSAAASVWSGAVGPRPVIVGADWDYPPYEYLDGAEPQGFNIDLLQALAKVLDLDVDLRLGPWFQVRTDLEEGRLDFLTGMFHSPERARHVDFTTPFLTVRHAIFTRRGSSISGVEDLAGREILVEELDVMHEFLLAQPFEATVIPVKGAEEMLRILASGRHDAALLGRVQGLYLIERHGLSNLVEVGEPFLPRDYCLAVPKGHDELRDLLNEGLAILRATGRYDEIYRKWFGPYERRASPWLVYSLALGFGLFLLLALVVLLWNRALRAEVARRTKELEEELQRRYLLEEELLRAATTDPLTGLLNRSSFEEALAREMARSDRYGLPLSAILFDLDGFKSVNDRFGHGKGDAVLRSVASVIKETLRLSDIFARWGGDEFLILVPQGGREAQALARRLSRLLGSLVDPMPLSASFGIAVYRPGETREALIHRADLAMYRAKAAPEEPIVVADEDLDPIHEEEKT
ncbi:MAG: transporter substrate-binding domain-containing protein [Synergistaceae bacterium]|nr:transporter substrate-binding domain-containing protein [Synergistaceae bacterium]